MELTEISDKKTREQVETVLTAFESFDVQMDLAEVKEGRNDLHVQLKTKKPVRMKIIKGFEDDLCYALGIKGIEIEAPLRGTSLIEIKIPKEIPTHVVEWKEMVSSAPYKATKEDLSVPLGKDEFNSGVVVDIHTLPHMLVCGATGSGKSMFLHSIINTLLMRNRPERLRFIMDDAKRVELSLYNDIPHLLTPVIYDSKKTVMALRWLGKEMDRRYAILETAGVLNIESYHSTVVQLARKDTHADLPETMPYIVTVIDELADSMHAYPKEMEAAIIQLTLKSRAVGIHLIISTSRPSRKVLTDMIKANIPARIAFQTASVSDSRVALDRGGAELLRGAGDALYLANNTGEPIRIQTPHISEDEIREHVKAIKNKYPEDSLHNENLTKSTFRNSYDDEDVDDELYEAARVAVIEAGKASTSYIQRKLRVGYARAARLMDMLTERGVIDEGDGAQPRKVLERPSDY